MEKPNKVDNFFNKLKNNRFLYRVIIVGVIVIGIGTFVDSILKITPIFERNKAKLQLVQFAINEAKSSYKGSQYDLSKKIFPSSPVVFSNGKIHAFGKQFDSNKEYKEYEQNLTSRTNHYFFGWLEQEGYSPREVPLVFDLDLKTSDNEEIKEIPYFIISMKNDGDKQLIIDRLTFKVLKVIPILSAGKSKVLEPLATYDIEIESKEGLYSKNLVPPIKVASNDAISLELRIIPKTKSQSPTGKILIGQISINWNDGVIRTEKFMLKFND